MFMRATVAIGQNIAMELMFMRICFLVSDEGDITATPI